MGELFPIDDITAGDLMELAKPLPPGGYVQKLRAPHHQIAKLLADGVRAVEVSAITGYSQVRISTLKADPAFQELMEYYATVKGAIFADAHQRLANLGISAIEELQERIESDPEAIPTPVLLKIMDSALDRSVAPTKSAAPAAPQAAPTNISISFVGSSPKVIDN